MKRAAALLLILIFALAAVPLSLADDGEAELTGRCVFVLPEKTTGNGAARLRDGSVMTRVRIPAKATLRAELPGGAAGVYLSWYEAPDGASITLFGAAGETLAFFAPSGLLNEWLPLPAGTAALEIAAERELVLSDVRVFSTGEAPGWLPLAQPVLEKTDLLLVAGHAGDEQMDLGGALAHYAGERGLACAVAFCSHKNRQALQDSLYALKLNGVPYEPLCLNLPDRTYYNPPELELKKIWKEPEAAAALARVIRRCRPEVLVAHAAAGEESEGIKKLASRVTLSAVKKAADPVFEPWSATAPWQVKKVYLHEDGENAVRLPMDAPLTRFGGQTAVALANRAYGAYGFTGVYHRTVKPDGTFTLAVSTVGPDTGKNDLFEHIPAGEPTVVNSASPAPLLPAVTPTPSPVPAGAGTPLRIPGVPTPAPTDRFADFFRQPGEPAETVKADYAAGVYEYRSDDLSVRIETRRTEKPAVYHVAHIRMRNTDAFRPGFGHPREGGMTKQSAEGIARRYKAVLLITGDDLIHMEAEQKGILLRNGRYYSGKQGEATLAMRPGLAMRIYFPYQTTYQQLLDEGVENTYSFGPVLVYGGKVYKYAYKHRTRTRNPRIGVGMVAPGHFVAIAVDGRIAGYSVGMEMMEFARLFEQEGCEIAYNLDGGASEAMVFMGEYVSLRAEKHVRTMPDALMWGYSEQAPDEDAPLVHSGVYSE